MFVKHFKLKLSLDYIALSIKQLDLNGMLISQEFLYCIIFMIGYFIAGVIGAVHAPNRDPSISAATVSIGTFFSHTLLAFITHASFFNSIYFLKCRHFKRSPAFYFGLKSRTFLYDSEQDFSASW